MSRSYANLLDLTGETPMFAKGPRKLGGMLRSMTVAGLAAEGREEDNTNSVTSDAPSSITPERLILVSHMLPLIASREGDKWSFKWDENSLQLQLKDGLDSTMEVLHVGCLKVSVEPSEQDSVSATLLDRFNCVPAFLPEDLWDKFYSDFCKTQLWPMLHYKLPLGAGGAGLFDRTVWQAYVSANKIFADKVMEVISPDDDYVWVHDYHLMVLPTFLRRKFHKVRLGFFLHSPFPSSEIYRTCPVRDEILRALLNNDLIGFHTFDYARHFLSCCSRMLGLRAESVRGHIMLEYYGRQVGVKVMPVGVHLPQLARGLRLADTEWRMGELKSQFEGKLVLLGVDDMDVFKGLTLKLLGLEQLLRSHSEWVGRAVLVQIAFPARGRNADAEPVAAEVGALVQRINAEFGRPGYQPVVLVHRPVPLYERIAFYTQAHCCVVTAVRDGMNLIPYEYIVCRQGAGRSTLIVSEFIGCSPSLSGAVRVNPWNAEAVAAAMNAVLLMTPAEQALRHEKHAKYVAQHDVGFWAASYMNDLGRIAAEHARMRCYGMGFGHGFRVVALDPNFRKLSSDLLIGSFRLAHRRTILLDYDGALGPVATLSNAPPPETLAVLSSLTADPANRVFLVSGAKRDELAVWFGGVERLGLAAEHGYYIRWASSSAWETLVPPTDDSWMETVRPVMESYTERTDGASLDVKESSLVWRYNAADPEFGTWQAKELVYHLEGMLAGGNAAVAARPGRHTVEVKPVGVSQGALAEKVLASFMERPVPGSGGGDGMEERWEGEGLELVLCVGDDRSDEDMFERIAALGSGSAPGARPGPAPRLEVFACTVGQKPSKARYYLDDQGEVLAMLQSLASSTAPADAGPADTTHTSHMDADTSHMEVSVSVASMEDTESSPMTPVPES